MNYNKKFNSQLIQGQSGEHIVAGFLKKRGFRFKAFWSGKEYDIELYRRKKVLVEVKCDRYSTFKKKTDNMFIETGYRGSLSGPWRSKADFFFYVFPDEDLLYCITMDNLRKLLKNPEVAEYVSSAGDKGWSSGFKLNRSKVENYFKMYKLL